MWHMNKNNSGRTLAGTAFTAVYKLPSHGSYSVHSGPSALKAVRRRVPCFVLSFFSMNAQVILLEDGWNRLKTGGVQKIEEILEDMQGGVYKSKISTDEYSALYT